MLVVLLINSVSFGHQKLKLGHVSLHMALHQNHRKKFL